MMLPKLKKRVSPSHHHSALESKFKLQFMLCAHSRLCALPCGGVTWWPAKQDPCSSLLLRKHMCLGFGVHISSDALFTPESTTQLHSNSGGNLSKLQNITDVVIMALTMSFLFLKHQDSAVAHQWISNNILHQNSNTGKLQGIC
ncbi:hypothetical protein KC19_3G176700 [Ceratodon purpureus]|uniref:Uncharacterized protein n=1 Tax=Ceratodon purpureus TaxID=3225 RepID=A0A8T0IM00_CERPU|nr:hypothetical protein KC19_3G176700 [Ceratodon purpureus]